MSSPKWRNSEVTSDRSWEYFFTNDQCDELVNAAHGAVAAGQTIATLSAANFPLPGLAPLIAQWSMDLSEGRGFVLVHGFPIDRLSEEETSLAYAGLGVHLGVLVGQNRDGDLTTDIRDDRLEQTGEIRRLYRTRDRQDFHSDAADIIGLLCMHTAKSGGESKIVSSAAVYAEMMRCRPDLVDELRTPLQWDRQNDHREGDQPWFTLAPIFDLNGESRIFYVGWYIRNAQRHADVPRLTERQLEAMELLESITNDSTFHLEMEFQPGDIQLLNNGRILHAREAFEDWEDLSRRRHLIRLWLAAHNFSSVEDKLRAGAGSSS
jgi:hypothetical protein